MNPRLYFIVHSLLKRSFIASANIYGDIGSPYLKPFLVSNGFIGKPLASTLWDAVVIHVIAHLTNLSGRPNSLITVSIKHHSTKS